MTNTRIPLPIARLDELAHNLWWSWSPEARMLFRSVSVRLWRQSDHNPVRMLHEVTPDRLERLSRDPIFLAHYEQVMKLFDDYMLGLENGEHQLDSSPSVAYFSAEYGLHGSLPIYSGGLGILSGDHAKTASDQGLNFTAIGFMYPKGYFEQEISAEGDQIAHYADLDVPNVAVERAYLSSGEPLMVDVPLESPDDLLHLQVWLIRCGRTKIYLMDSNVEKNKPWNREITTRLYGGDREYRLRQEIALGIGGVRVVRALGLQPDVWHANEGHVAFMFLERLRELLSVNGERRMENGELTRVNGSANHSALPSPLLPRDAIERIRQSSIFTTHTPVPAGHDAFSLDLIERYFWHYWPQLGMNKQEFFSLGEHEGAFNMTALSMKLASRVNAVSKKHREVTTEMWPNLITEDNSEAITDRNEKEKPSMIVSKPSTLMSVTNGVHIPTWLAPEMEMFFSKEMGEDWRDHLADDNYWHRILSLPDEGLWRVRQMLKTSLFSFITDRARRKWLGDGYNPNLFVPSGLLLDPSILTIGFARRFATYKRATLIFKDLDRLKQLVSDPLRPIQIIFSGKAHPADEGGKYLIREIWQHAQDPAFNGRIAFIENYGMHSAKYLVRGVDIWMNNPKAPLEASGTSGMKAAINGVPNFSVLDGWWMEAFEAPGSLSSSAKKDTNQDLGLMTRNGWGFEGATEGSQEDQDRTDATRMYDLLQQEIIPAYYDKESDGIPHRWLQIAKASIATVLPRFSSERMLNEYVELLYKEAAKGVATV